MGLANPPAFFVSVRSSVLGPDLSQSEVNGCDAILAAMEGSPLAYCAYALATAYRETASTMQPIREYGGPTYFTRMYDITGARPKMAAANGNTHPGDGPKYCGRGYVQLTWRNNYDRAGRALGVDLVEVPELAMRPDIAAKVMRRGMDEGWFSGKKFADYLPHDVPASRGQFDSARRIINGTDHADEIAGHALEFQAALEAGNWS